MLRWPSLRNEIVIVVLALISVALIIIEITADLAPADREFLDRVDLTIAFVFLIEWIWRFVRSENRAAFARRYWWELLASIPLTYEVTQALRGLRVLRIVRVIRVLRVIRLGTRLNVLLSHSQRLVDEARLIGVSTTTGVLVLAATLAFYSFEYGVNPNVRNLFDSFWWAMCTVTTVGYGDIAPMTSEGRFVGLLLMVFGAGLMATFTALIASHLVRARVRDEKKENA